MRDTTDSQTPPESARNAISSIGLAYHLREIGWVKHQHRASVARHEAASTPFIGPLDEATARSLARCQHIIDSQCLVPPPDLNLPYTPWDTGPSGGLRLRFADPNARPTERSLTHTHELEPDKAATLWRTIVEEVAAGWATTARHVRSAGRVFLGPRDRFIFWPKELNKLLAHVTVAYGRVVDLLSVLALYGVKLDIKAAYRALRLDPDDVPYHGAIIDAVHVCFERLSFGMAQSPVMFTTALAVTIDAYRDSMPATRAALAQFVDDSGIGGTSVGITIDAAERLLIALRRDGWWLAAAKTYLWPTTTLSYTGFLVDFASRSVCIDPAKAAKVVELLREIQRPSDEALDSDTAACAIAAAPPGPASATPPHAPCDHATYRRQLVSNAIRSPGFTTLALGQPIGSDFDHHVRTRIVRGPMPLAPVDNVTVVGSHEYTCPSGLHRAVTAACDAAASDQPPSTVFVLLPPGRQPDVLRTLSDAPPPVPVVAFASDPGRAPGATLWCDPSLRLPPHVGNASRRPLPAPSSLPTPPPQSGTRLDLTGPEFDALRRAQGYMSWFQVALPCIGTWRASVGGLLQTGRWNTERAVAFDALWSVLHVVANFRFSIDPPAQRICVITDASGVGWGAVVHARGRAIHFAGTLPPEVRVGSSTLREATAAVSAIRCAIELGVSFDGVLVRTDNAALEAAGNGRVRSETVAKALWPIAAWAIQGLRVDFEWQSREHASHARPDALSAAVGPSPWPLTPQAASRVWDFANGWQVDVMAYGGHESRMAPAYATPALSEASASCRRTVLSGFRPDSSVGWQGLSTDLELSPGQTGFAYPLWSHLRDLLQWWRRRPCRLVVVAPKVGHAWWAPFIGELDAIAARSFDLSPASTTPPEPGIQVDPRQLTARLLLPPGPTAVPPRPAPPPWYIPAPTTATAVSPSAWAPPVAPGSAVRSDTAPPPSGWAPPAAAGPGRADPPPPNPPPPPATATVPSQPSSQWATPQDPPAADHRAFRSAQGTPAQLGWVLGGHCPKDRPPRRLRDLLGGASDDSPPAAAQRTGRTPAPASAAAPRGPREHAPPTHPPAPPPTTSSSLRDALGAAQGRHPRIGSAARDTSRPAPVRHPLQPPPVVASTRVRSAPSAQPTDAPDAAAAAAAAAPDAQANPADPHGPAGAPHAPAAARAATRHSHAAAATTDQPALTCGGWLLSILRHHGSRHGVRASAAVAGHEHALRAAARATTQAALQGSGASVAVAEQALAFARHRRVTDAAWSAARAEAFVLDYCQARSGKSSASRPSSWTTVSVATAMGEASALAGASRRAGHAVPPYCGPLVDNWCTVEGGRSKPEHSKAYPIHLAHILKAEPPAGTPEHEIWVGLALSSFFCLRTGVSQHLHSHMFVPYDGGYLCVWRFPHKRTARLDSHDPAAMSAIGAISAARHPALTRILDPFVRQKENVRVCATATCATMSQFVRDNFPGAPPSFNMRAYGVRTGADADATLLKVPPDVVDTLFCWKRSGATARMQHYYSGINIRHMFTFTERRVQIQFKHLFAGRFAGTVPSRALLDWKSPLVSKEPLPPTPDYEVIGRAMQAQAPSLAAAKQLRTTVRRVRARRAAGELSTESASDGSVEGTLETVCCICSKVLGPTATASVCSRCPLASCHDCTDPRVDPYYCPAHARRPPPAKRRRR